MPTVTVTLHPPYDGDYARHGVEFSSVHFSAPLGTDPDWLELSLRVIPGCATLVEFEFDLNTGDGRFILLDSEVFPGDYRLKGPARYALEVDARIQHNGREYGQIFTHIETDMWHALCGAEQGGTITNRRENDPVTCPACRERWQRCQVYVRSDFENLKWPKEATSSFENTGLTADISENIPYSDAKKANKSQEDARQSRRDKWGLLIIVVISLTTILGL